MPPTGSYQFYLSSYFITNTLLIFAYPILRLYTSAGKKNLKLHDSFGFTYENSIIYTVLILAIMGYLKSTSLRGFLVDVFSVGKVGVIALLVFAKFRFAVIYTIVALVMWMIVPYPRYEAENKFIKIKSVEQFD